MIYSENKVFVERIITEVELNVIISIEKDSYLQAAEAGFGERIPLPIDLFVCEKGADNARKIIEVLTN